MPRFTYILKYAIFLISVQTYTTSCKIIIQIISDNLKVSYTLCKLNSFYQTTTAIMTHDHAQYNLAMDPLNQLSFLSLKKVLGL